MPQIKINRWLSTTVLTTAIAVSLMACQSTSTENTTKSEMNINKTTPLTVERIYKDNEFSSDSISRLRWLVDGSGYTVLEKSATTKMDDKGENVSIGNDIVVYDPETLEKSVLISAEQLTPNGADKPLAIHNYTWSDDRKKLLVYTNSKKVWRSNSRGDYWLLDIKTNKLNQLGGKKSAESSLMFAKFSPDASKVAYVVADNIYVENLSDNKVSQLTFDAGDGKINVVKKLHEWAIANKRTPESLQCGEPLHVDFLYSMFTRDSPTKLVQQAKASGTELEWKKIIAEHAALFSDSIGRMKCEPFRFDLKDPMATSKRRAYPMSPVKTLALSKMVELLMENDVLEASKSVKWNSPVLLIAKPDGRYRFIVDFSHVNRLVQNLPVAYPRPEDLLDFCTDAWFMAQIDCKDFYFCREVDEECRDCLTFTVPSHGALRFKRLPQGFIASSAAAIVPVINQMREVLFSKAEFLPCRSFLLMNDFDRSFGERQDLCSMILFLSTV